MILLFSSAGKETYKQFVLQVLCCPSGYQLRDVPYSLDIVHPMFRGRPELLAEHAGLVVFVTYTVEGGQIQPVYFPMRECLIVKGYEFAGKLLVDLNLGAFVYYDERAQRSYAQDIAMDPRRLWNKVIRQEADAPHAVPRPPHAAINPADPRTWKSAGFFVVKVDDGIIDVSVDPQKEADVLKRCEDWKSIIDVVSPEKQLADKLFYQVWALQMSPSQKPVTTTMEKGRTFFTVHPGASVDLILHFYQGQERRPGAKKILEITVDPEFASVIGQTSIDVRPEQASGKLERIGLLIKNRLVPDVTRVTIQERNVLDLSLAKMELYLMVRPKLGLIVSIFSLFFVGTLLNGLPTEPVWLWALKVTGSLLMAVSFWLAFRKFPTKD